MFYSFLRGTDGQVAGKGRIIEVVEERLRQALAPMIGTIRFDEKFYTRQYGDVAENLNSGDIASAHGHYVNFGYYEDRLPREVVVDEGWYLSTYEDVARAVADGKFLSGRQHFLTSGFKEGRLPSQGWSLYGAE